MTEEELERKLELLMAIVQKRQPVPYGFVSDVLDFENHPENEEIFEERVKRTLEKVTEEQFFGHGPGSTYEALSEEDKALHEETLMGMSEEENARQRELVREVAREIWKLANADADEAKISVIQMPKRLEEIGVNRILTGLLRKVILQRLKEAGLEEYIELLGLTI